MPQRPLLSSTAFGICLVALLCAAEAAEIVRVTSPNGRIELVFSLREDSVAENRLSYQVFFDKRPVLAESQLGLHLSGGSELGQGCRLTASSSQPHHIRFLQRPGKQLIVDVSYSEAVLQLAQRDGRELRWEVVARAFDDGIAFRYRIPQQANLESCELTEDRTTFCFVPDTEMTYLPLEGFVSSHEAYYQSSLISALPQERLFGLPALCELPHSTWVAILEAQLKDSGGLYLEKSPVESETLVSRVSPLPTESQVCARQAVPCEFPWRVILVAEDSAQLMESQLVLSLNAPTKIEDSSWIQPGKTTFPWWNGYFEEEVPFQPGLNSATVKHYIDFCAEYGIPYHSLDGLDNVAWYGGPIVPYAGAKPLQGVPGLDLPEILAYAKQKNVRLRLWMHWQAAQAHMHEAFPLYKKWGIEGVMVDFMDRDDQEMVDFLEELLELAGENQLTVSLHGVAPPTGLERTFPNLLTSEGILNLEYDKWDSEGVPPKHDLHAAQIRMLAGPLDYHQGSLRTVSAESFEAREKAPLVIGTPVRTAATYVVLQNHLPMLADYPTAYRRHSLSGLLASIPSSWDETRVLESTLGQSVVVARRHGADWWIGAMTDATARSLEVPLAFLSSATYRASVYSDELNAPQQFSLKHRRVSARDTLQLHLTGAGGAVVRLVQEKPAERAGWKFVWGDDFKELSSQAWHIQGARDPQDEINFPHVKGGVLVIPASSGPRRQEVRHGLIASNHLQRFGRWEVRAKLPKTSGLRAAFRLLPDAAWPTGGEIEPLVFFSSVPDVTASEFHWGSSSPLQHDSRLIQQRSMQAGRLVDYSRDFHTFAVEWLPDQLRFYVDDLYHTVYYSDEIGDFLPRLTQPMRMVFDLQPSVSRAANQALALLEIDWIRVYQLTDQVPLQPFRNGSFENQDGSLEGWHVFGNRLSELPNVSVDFRHACQGFWSLALAGQGSDGESYSGVTQGIPVQEGQSVTATVSALVSSQQPIAGGHDRATLKIEFYKNAGDYFGGPAMLGFQEVPLADNSAQPDHWHQHKITAVAPAESVEARLSIVYFQEANAPGAVFIDDVHFAVEAN